MDELPKLENLIFDIDLRLRELWEIIDTVEEWSFELIVQFCRVAYAEGYYAAIRETDDGLRDKLANDNGYPTRKSKS